MKNKIFIIFIFIFSTNLIAKENNSLIISRWFKNHEKELIRMTKIKDEVLFEYKHILGSKVIGEKHFKRSILNFNSWSRQVGIKDPFAYNGQTNAAEWKCSRSPIIWNVSTSRGQKEFCKSEGEDLKMVNFFNHLSSAFAQEK